MYFKLTFLLSFAYLANMSMGVPCECGNIPSFLLVHPANDDIESPSDHVFEEQIGIKIVEKVLLRLHGFDNISDNQIHDILTDLMDQLQKRGDDLIRKLFPELQENMDGNMNDFLDKILAKINDSAQSPPPAEPIKVAPEPITHIYDSNIEHETYRDEKETEHEEVTSIPEPESTPKVPSYPVQVPLDLQQLLSQTQPQEVNPLAPTGQQQGSSGNSSSPVIRIVLRINPPKPNNA